MRFCITYGLLFSLVFYICMGSIQAQNILLNNNWKINLSDTQDIPGSGWENWDLDNTLPSQARFWLRTTITNAETDTISKILYLGSAQDVDIIIGDSIGRSLNSYKTGTILPASERDMAYGFVISGLGSSAQAYIDIPPGKSDLYLRSTPLFFEKLDAEIMLFDEADWYRTTVRENNKTFLIQGLVGGALLIISFYHFLIFIIRRDWAFFWYAVYTIFVAISMLLETGVLQIIFFKEYSYTSRIIWEVQVISMISAVFYFVFMRSFLDLKKLIPWLDKLVCRILFVVIPFSLLLKFYYINTLQQSAFNFISPITILLLGLFCVFQLIRTGNKLAMYFAMGSLILFVSVFTNTILSILVTYQVISEPTFPRVWFTEVGIIFEILIFSLGLGYRLRLQDQEQELSLSRLRTKISSDLHDDVGSMLTGLSMQSNVMSYTADGPMKEKLKQISEISRSALETMRDTVWAIDARQDNFDSLTDKMRDFAEVNIPEDRLSYTFTASGLQGNESILPDIRQQTYLIYKEAISNAIKYSNGDRIDVKLERSSTRLQLTIHDNGNAPLNQQSSGQGIKNMKMRADQLGGSLTVSFDSGCRVAFVLSV